MHFADGGSLALRDPRRLGAVELDPDEDRLGVDALAVTTPQLPGPARPAAGPDQGRRSCDQSGVAGLGNLLVDEILWRAGVDPDRTRPVARRRPRTGDLARTHPHHAAGPGPAGGSHTGDLMAARQPDGSCPRDGAPLRRGTVGGRTTYWCPIHQR